MRFAFLWALTAVTAVTALPATGKKEKVSTDGSCGPDNGGMTCTGSAFGTCCSA